MKYSTQLGCCRRCGVQHPPSWNAILGGDRAGTGRRASILLGQVTACRALARTAPKRACLCSDAADVHAGLVMLSVYTAALKRARACVQACACVDTCLKELLDVCDEVNGRWLVTSDHGNADDMVQRSKKGEPLYEEGRPVPLTSHTLAPVGVAVGGADLPSSVKVRLPCFHACATAQLFAHQIRHASAVCRGSEPLAHAHVCSCWKPSCAWLFATCYRPVSRHASSVLRVCVFVAAMPQC